MKNWGWTIITTPSHNYSLWETNLRPSTQMPFCFSSLGSYRKKILPEGLLQTKVRQFCIQPLHPASALVLRALCKQEQLSFVFDKDEQGKWTSAAVGGIWLRYEKDFVVSKHCVDEWVIETVTESSREFRGSSPSGMADCGFSWRTNYSISPWYQPFLCSFFWIIEGVLLLAPK